MSRWAGRSGSATAGSPTGHRATTSGSTSTRRSSPRCPSTWRSGARTPRGRGCWAIPSLYPEIEEQLTELVGAEDSLVLPTITHIHMSVIPVLVGDGAIFLDGRAHKTIYDGAMVAAGHGATVAAVPPQRLRAPGGAAPRAAIPAAPAADRDGRRQLDDRQRARPRRVLAPGPGARRPALRRRCARLRRDRRAFAAARPSTTAIKGNGVFRHLDVPYDNAVLVAGFSKSYSSLLAFIALPTRLKDALKVLAPPVPVLGTLAGGIARHDAGRAGGQPHAWRRLPRRICGA